MLLYSRYSEDPTTAKQEVARNTEAYSRRYSYRYRGKLADCTVATDTGTLGP